MHKKRKAVRLAVLTAAAALLISCCGSSYNFGTVKGTDKAAEGQTYAQQQEKKVDRAGNDLQSEKDMQLDLKDKDSTLSRVTRGKKSRKKTTVMIYMTGSDLESRSGAASADLRELVKSGVDPEKNNVLVYTGGSTRWHTNISSDYNSLYRLTKKGLTLAARTEDARNMGDASTFSRFLTYCFRHYPASHYGLICWDHGSGPLYGFGSDELFDNDSLLLAEMQLGLEDSPFGKNRKLDWVGFDACMMASAELCSVWQNYADYLVASQEAEPGAGWDYSFLSVLNRTSDSRTVARKILNSYKKFYEKPESVTGGIPVTLSCMDLSGTGALQNAMSSLFSRMSADLTKHYDRIAGARAKTKAFGLSAAGSRQNALDLVDVKDMADKVSSFYPAEASALSGAVDAMVVAETGQAEDAGGISMYYPYENRRLYRKNKTFILNSVPMADAYQKYLRAYSRFWNAGSGETARIPDDLVEVTDDTITVDLKDAGISRQSQVTENIFLEISDGVYVPVVSNVVLSKKNGKASAGRKGEVVVASDSSGQQKVPWPVRQLESGKWPVYVTENTYVQKKDGETAGEASGSSAGTENAQKLPVNLNFRVAENEHHHILLDGLQEDSESQQNTGKNTIDMDTCGQISNDLKYYKPAVDRQGHTRSYEQWTDAGRYETQTLSMDGFDLEIIDTGDLAGDYYCQIQAAEPDGQVYATELYPLRNH